MTFNATALPLEGRTDGEIKLFARKPLKPIGEGRGRLYVTEDVADLLDGKKHFELFPDLAAERLIGIFCASQLLTVSRKRNDKLPDLERLEGMDEIWSLCPRRPKPGWRLLGRFLERDRLVLLRAWDKRSLVGNYEKAAKEVIDDWEKVFGTRSAHSAAEIGDYYSGVFRDVDLEEE